MVEEQSAGSGVPDLSDFKAAISKKILSQTTFYKDFPRKGVNFMDLFSITAKPKLFREVLDAVKTVIENEFGHPSNGAFTCLVGLEARGFVLGPILALEWNIPFYPIRKAGKLPGECIKSSYQKEYGPDDVEIQKGIFSINSKVLLIDDLLATGGTLNAAHELIKKCENAYCVGSAVVFEIEGLNGRSKLNHNCSSLVILKD